MISLINITDCTIRDILSVLCLYDNFSMNSSTIEHLLTFGFSKWTSIRMRHCLSKSVDKLSWLYGFLIEKERTLLLFTLFGIGWINGKPVPTNSKDNQLTIIARRKMSHLCFVPHWHRQHILFWRVNQRNPFKMKMNKSSGKRTVNKIKTFSLIPRNAWHPESADTTTKTFSSYSSHRHSHQILIHHWKSVFWSFSKISKDLTLFLSSLLLLIL